MYFARKCDFGFECKLERILSHFFALFSSVLMEPSVTFRNQERNETSKSDRFEGRGCLQLTVDNSSFAQLPEVNLAHVVSDWPLSMRTQPDNDSAVWASGIYPICPIWLSFTILMPETGSKQNERSIKKQQICTCSLKNENTYLPFRWNVLNKWTIENSTSKCEVCRLWMCAAGSAKLLPFWRVHFRQQETKRETHWKRHSVGMSPTDWAPVFNKYFRFRSICAQPCHMNLKYLQLKMTRWLRPGNISILASSWHLLTNIRNSPVYTQPDKRKCFEYFLHLFSPFQKKDNFLFCSCCGERSTQLIQSPLPHLFLQSTLNGGNGWHKKS